MRKTLFAVALSIPMFASAATNLLTNGSFESGFTGWTVSSGATYDPTVITYGTSTPATYNESIAVDNAASASPDAAGTKGVYLVDDSAVQTLSQQFTIASAGTYLIGFDTYATSVGYGNSKDALFSVKIDSTVVFSSSVAALPLTTWQAQVSSVVLSTPGVHTFTFTFTPGGAFAKDMVLDRAYVSAATAVPEPESYALMLAGLTAVGFLARRRNRA